MTGRVESSRVERRERRRHDRDLVPRKNVDRCSSCEGCERERGGVAFGRSAHGSSLAGETRVGSPRVSPVRIGEDLGVRLDEDAATVNDPRRPFDEDSDRVSRWPLAIRSFFCPSVRCSLPQSPRFAFALANWKVLGQVASEGARIKVNTPFYVRRRPS